MRIAHLDTGREWRGGQAQVLLLLAELRARGHAQRLLAPAGPLLARARDAGFETQRWESRGELDLPALLRARRALAAYAPEVAHLHTAHAHALGAPAARLAGVPAVVVSRRVDFRVARHPLSRLKYALPVDLYLCISDGVRAALAASGVAEERLARVPSGVDLAAVRAQGAAPAPDLRAWLGLPADAEVVGTVAALAPHKNHALLLEAAPAVIAARPRAHFVWLGEGECRGALERRRAALGL
ncbi:MAG TPA: glycosyltransferase, partial [Candidatus Eisenbacteria bacterium]|nr:glycosyltransferase [Candidatus Eisenbacteria bacterium]